MVPVVVIGPPDIPQEVATDATVPEPEPVDGGKVPVWAVAAAAKQQASKGTYKVFMVILI
jgi:hypothetical protein